MGARVPEAAMNPYTPIRRFAQALLAEVRGIVAEVTLLELQEAGVRVPDAAEPIQVSESPRLPSDFLGAQLAKVRRGRPRKIEAPPFARQAWRRAAPTPTGKAS